MINGNLEYLMSSLPDLYFQVSDELRSKVSSLFRNYAGPEATQKNLIPIFEGEAQKYLSSGNFDLLHQINLNNIHSTTFQQSKNRVLAAFSKYAFSMKEDIRHLRISRRKDSEQTLPNKISLPIAPGNPLDEELQLLKLQWDKLEALSIGHYADFSALILYKLKLLVLLRWWSFDQNKGFEIFLQTVKKD